MLKVFQPSKTCTGKYPIRKSKKKKIIITVPFGVTIVTLVYTHFHHFWKPHSLSLQVKLTQFKAQLNTTRNKKESNNEHLVVDLVNLTFFQALLFNREHIIINWSHYIQVELTHSISTVVLVENLKNLKTEEQFLWVQEWQPDLAINFTATGYFVVIINSNFRGRIYYLPTILFLCA